MARSFRGRPLRRRFAGKKGGRRFFWYRFTPAGVTLREAATATHSDIIVDEGFWQSTASASLNDQVKGGPRLERFIMDYGLSLQGSESFWAASADANIAIIPEFMVWKQSDQFATIVTNSASFNSTREKQRIIMDEIPLFEQGGQISNTTSFSIRSVRGRYETKTKVRLNDGALGVAWRGLFDEGSGNLQGYTDWVRCTFLISLP